MRDNILKDVNLHSMIFLIYPIKAGTQKRGTNVGKMGNVQEDSGECSRRFRKTLEKIPGNVQEGSGECSKRFPGMLEKVPGNFDRIPGNV